MRFSQEVQRFAEAMQTELDANAHKGDWHEFTSAGNIITEIAWHQAKLLMALKANDLPKILEHSADCANYYMMIANLYGTLKNLPAPGEDSGRDA